MARKIYECIGYLKLSLTINVGDESKNIEFTGGGNYPKPSNGRYVTENKKIQDVLEESENFGNWYKLVYVDNVSLEPEVKKPSAEEQLEQLKKENERLSSELMKTEKPKEEEKERNFKVVTEVYNAQQAKEYLINEYPEEFATKNLPNKVTILKRAAEKGISFVDWDENKA